MLAEAIAKIIYRLVETIMNENSFSFYQKSQIQMYYNCTFCEITKHYITIQLENKDRSLTNEVYNKIIDFLLYFYFFLVSSKNANYNYLWKSKCEDTLWRLE